MKKTGRPLILETRCLERTGITMTEYYRQCSGKMNIYAAAKGLDVSPNTIYNWLHRNRLEWSSPTDNNREPFRFEFRGRRGTRSEHCRLAGVKHGTVSKIMLALRVGFADAVDIAAYRAKARDEIIAIKDRCRAAGISESNVRKIRKDYGISAADALEIAIVRKATREARDGK